jgi:hypothetical protein
MRRLHCAKFRRRHSLFNCGGSDQRLDITVPELRVRHTLEGGVACP